VDKLGVDFLSMSAHKIYGPKGIGALYIRKGSPIKQVQDGGGQEWGKRAGTHNVPGIVGLGAALAEVKSKKSKVKNKEILFLRNHLIEKVLKEIPGAKLNGSKTKRSPNNANFTFPNVEGESLILMLDMEGIAASTGSACSSGSLSPSHVLLSLGMKPEQAHGSLRLTLGKYTTKKDIEYTVPKIKSVVEKLRKVSGNVLSEYYKSNKSHKTN
jgi:cysteine desulfurase